MKRILALSTALAVAASGSGLPMCANLLAQVVEPCGMHQHTSGHKSQSPQVAPGHHDGGACHSGDGDIGCATGGTCPSGSAAAPFTPASVLIEPELARDVTRAIDRAYRSFLSPPPAPPPQA